ncbi:MAG: aminotransferase class IV [Actinomyces sp.]|nr:aminotransferase class IV [Actinomyces sp.]
MTFCILVSPLEASDPTPTDGRLQVVDPGSPQVSVLDLGVTRGDGVFEVLGVVGGHAQAVDAHLSRLQNSAMMLDLPAPDLEAVRAAVLQVVALSEPVPEMLVKIVLTRGVEDAEPAAATCWVIGLPAGDHEEERRRGVSVVLLDRGYPHDISSRAPWLLTGAKTLSYAVNKAALREAARRGADDVVFTSSDGYVLEGPTSTLLARFGTRIWTPAIAQGLLPGTTQAAAFEFFATQGLSTSEVLLRSGQLADADALWLASSVRMLAPVRSVDGWEVPVDQELTAAANAFLLGRVE